MDRFVLYFFYNLLLAFLISLVGCSTRQDGRDSNTRAGEDSVQTDSLNVQQTREIIRSRTLGLAYLEENKLEEAEEEFKKLIALAPEEALGYANLGIVYMRMGDYEEAEKQLEKAISLNPDDPDIRFNLAQVYDLVNKEEESRRELEKSVEQTPDHLQSLYGLAESYQGQSDTLSVNQWEKYLRKIVENSPANIVARLYLIEALIRNERAGTSASRYGNNLHIGKILSKFNDRFDTLFLRHDKVCNDQINRLFPIESHSLFSVRSPQNIVSFTR